MKVEPRGLRTLLVHPDNDALLLDVGSPFSKWSLGDSNP